jgi:hypothetical protein
MHIHCRVDCLATSQTQGRWPMPCPLLFTPNCATVGQGPRKGSVFSAAGMFQVPSDSRPAPSLQRPDLICLRTTNWGGAFPCQAGSILVGCSAPPTPSTCAAKFQQPQARCRTAPSACPRPDAINSSPQHPPCTAGLSSRPAGWPCTHLGRGIGGILDLRRVQDVQQQGGQQQAGHARDQTGDSPGACSIRSVVAL